MIAIYSLFFLVLTTHLALLINAVYQTAYTISRAMCGVNPLPIALSFAGSAAIIATVGVIVTDSLQNVFPTFVHILPAVGAVLLFWYAYHAYKLAISPCTCDTQPIDAKTIGAIFVMNLTSAHMLSDITLISGFYKSFHDDYGTVATSVTIIIAFALSAFIWFGCIGAIAYKLGEKLQFAKIHKVLHWASCILLVGIALAILTEAYTDLHIFGDHDHGITDDHDHTDDHDDHEDNDHEDDHDHKS